MNKPRGFAAVALANPKSGLNVGSVLRAAGCYDASLVVIGGNRANYYMGRLATDTQKAYRHIPVIRTSNVLDAIPYDCVPIAVELLPDATSIVNFVHPERAFYIFGPEDGTLGRAVTDHCKHKVVIPTRYCMNLAATVNVVLYDRRAKADRKAEYLRQLGSNEWSKDGRFFPSWEENRSPTIGIDSN